MKVYLGDSVYAELESGRITLTTENGFGPSNTIVLEDNVIGALLTFSEQIRIKNRLLQQLPQRLTPDDEKDTPDKSEGHE